MCGILALIKASASDTTVAADLHEATFMLQCGSSPKQAIARFAHYSHTGIEARMLWELRQYATIFPSEAFNRLNPTIVCIGWQDLPSQGQWACLRSFQ